MKYYAEKLMLLLSCILVSMSLRVLRCSRNWKQSLVEEFVNTTDCFVPRNDAPHNDLSFLEILLINVNHQNL